MALIDRAHCTVIFEIAQFSCLFGVRRSGATLICICSCLTADDDDDESSEDDDDDDEESDGNEDKVQQAETAAAAGDGQVEELSDRVEHLTSS